MNSLTEQQQIEIKNSNKTIAELKRIYKVTQNTIKYHQSDEFKSYLRKYQRERYSKLSKEKRRELLEKNREYQKQYHKNRYANDPEFRKKQIENASQYQKRKIKEKK